jgi:HTH-type transcriptional regulator/antitoxin HipB
MKLKISTAEQLATHFKSLRKAKGWSQADLGKRIGLKQARVAQIEGDPGSISVDKLFQVLHALEADFVIETQNNAPERTGAHSLLTTNWDKLLEKMGEKALAPHNSAPSLNLIIPRPQDDHSTPLQPKKPLSGKAVSDQTDTRVHAEPVKKPEE